MRATRLVLLISWIALAAGCSSHTAKNRYLLAEKLWTDGSYAAAVSEFDKVTAKDPRGKLGLQSLYRAATTQNLYLHQYDEALQKFRAYAGLSNDLVLVWDAQMQIGEILFSKTEQYEAAARHYRELIKIRPDGGEVPDFLLRIAKSYFFLSRFDEALDAYRDLAKRFPKLPQGERAAFEVGTTLYTRGGRNLSGKGTGPEAYDEAMDAFRDFLKQYPSSKYAPEAGFGIASCLEELDQLDAAYRQYESLLDTYPSPKVIRIKLARIQERKAQKSR